MTPALLLCTLLWVTDGDTVRLRCDAQDLRVRIFGLDCAEMNQSGGPEAKRAMQNLLKGRKITLKQKGFDRYGRTVGIVFADNRDVARRLIASGTCKEYCRYSHDKYGTCRKEF